MTLVCGTDFSSGAQAAARAACAWARRTNDTVDLVHAIDRRGIEVLLAREAGAGSESLRAELAVWSGEARKRLEADARALAAASGVSVRALVIEASADRALIEHAGATQARAIVVAALGTRAGSPFTLGSTADRVAQGATCPVLVVRAADAFERWAERKDPLRVLVAVDTTTTSDAALRWSTSFARSGDVVRTAAHVYWPPAEFEKHPSAGALPLGTGNLAVEQALERDLAAHILAHGGGEKLPLRLVGGLGRTADHVARIADEEHAHVIAIGSHQRGGLARFWHGSVSHGVVDRARTNVVVVPEHAG
jgi:nucleotide-binding universal stress UspA family protein